MNGLTEADKLFSEIPDALWAPGDPLPNVYHGTPIDMIRQMLVVIGQDPGVTVQHGIDVLSAALGGRMKKLRFTGNPSDEARAGLFVFALLRNGICQTLARA